MWDEMKEKARAASEQIAAAGVIAWPPIGSAAHDAMAGMPGASLFVTRLAAYIAEQGASTVRLHLVGHSAGAIFHAALLQRLVEAGIAVASVALLAPAIRVDEFVHDILPYLGSGGTVTRFATFAMNDSLERDDVCGAGDVDVYHKSLLYLVSRALERSTTGQGGEVPLLGMEKFFDQPLTGGAGLTLREAITQAGGTAIFSRAAAPPDARSGATSHGGFDDDPLTMTSVVMRLLGVAVPERQHDYQAHTPLLESGPPEPDTAPVGAVRSGVEIDDTRAAAAVVFTPSAAANPPGESPLVKTAQPQRGRPVAPAQP